MTFSRPRNGYTALKTGMNTRLLMGAVFVVAVVGAIFVLVINGSSTGGTGGGY